MDTRLALPSRHLTRSPSVPKRRTGPSTALGAWWSRARLDRDLARGADPYANPGRAYRARQLTTMATRRRIAADLERVLEKADSAWAGMSSEAPIQNRLVRDARPALHMLIDTLVADGPREPRGVALALLLLTDSASPLYAAGDSRALAQAALTAITALQDGRRP